MPHNIIVQEAISQSLVTILDSINVTSLSRMTATAVA